MHKRNCPSSPHSGRGPKRPKIETKDVLEDPHKEIRWFDIERTLVDARGTRNEDPGWISATVFMLNSSSSDKNRKDIQLTKGDGMLKISVFTEHSSLKLCSGQSIKLSLRNAWLVKKNSKKVTSNPGHLPFTLEFRRGVAMQFVNGKRAMQDGEIFDTLDVTREAEEGDWFLTPVPSTQTTERDLDDGLNDSHNNEPQIKLSTRTKRQRYRDKERAKKEDAQTVHPPSPEPPQENLLDMEAGLVSSKSGTYLPLRNLLESPGLRTQIIAVSVYSDEPQKTLGTDLKVKLVLTDPSVSYSPYGFSIVCFMKSEYSHLLPSPEEGKVVLLRNVHITKKDAKVYGVVYDDKLNWVQYNPSDGKFEFPPYKIKVDDRTMVTFYHANSEEAGYMRKLGAWYKSVQCQLIELPSSPKRTCQLLGSVDTNVFFDAVVEIIEFIEEGSFGQAQLFITDYTANNRVSSSNTYGQWALFGMTGKIPARDLEKMAEGQIWRIMNIRLKYGSSGFIEVDFYRAKYKLLDEANAEYDPDLKDFLQRKNDYLSVNSALKTLKTGGKKSDIDTFNLISEIQEERYYNFVAELVYKYSNEKVTDVFVTDYTENPKLSTSHSESLKRQLQGRSVPLLRIGCWDDRDNLRDMKPGDIVQFTEVRIMKYHDGFLQGRLKFTDQHTTKLDVSFTTDQRVPKLLQRKEEFEHKLTSTVPSPAVVDSVPENAVADPEPIVVKSKHTDQPISSIKQILGTKKCPNKFRLTARVIDFYPKDIQDFSIRICTNCKQEISKKFFACTSCSDMLHKYCQWKYRFFFMLEDKDGERMMSDVCSEAEHFLAGLKPCDLRDKENAGALEALKKRLEPCIGNIAEVHEHLKDEIGIKARYGSYMDLAVKSWKVKEQVVYSLTGCELVDTERP